MLDYAARNAILPNLTGFAMSLGFVRQRRDPGRVRLQLPGRRLPCCCSAVNNDDYPLMQALFLLITVAVLVAILLADIATAILDPRTRTARLTWQFRSIDGRASPEPDRSAASGAAPGALARSSGDPD